MPKTATIHDFKGWIAVPKTATFYDFRIVFHMVNTLKIHRMLLRFQGRVDPPVITLSSTTRCNKK